MTKLFEPYNISGLRLPNRIVRAATYEKRADEDGHVTDDLIDLYEELARGGAGLIITGGALVHHSGRYLRQTISVHSDSNTVGLARLAAAVHAEGGLIALQLDHGGRQCTALMLGGADPIGPWAVYNPINKSTPRAMEDSEIWQVVDAFASAAFRARTGNMDAVELRAGDGHLIGSFLSSYSNHRDDYWGGDPLRRSHFLEEIIKAIREQVGEDFPIIVKLNAEDHIDGGINSIEALSYAMVAQDAGADAIEISGGSRESDLAMLPPKEMEGHYRAAGELFRNSLSIPVILTGGFRTRDAMNHAIEGGAADMIGLSRALLRQPDLPRMMMENSADSDCDGCNKCLKFSRRQAVRCARG